MEINATQVNRNGGGNNTCAGCTCGRGQIAKAPNQNRQEPATEMTFEVEQEIIGLTLDIWDAKSPEELIEGVGRLRMIYGKALAAVGPDHRAKRVVIELIEIHLRAVARDVSNVESYLRSSIKLAYRRLREAAGIEKPERELTPA